VCVGLWLAVCSDSSHLKTRAGLSVHGVCALILVATGQCWKGSSGPVVNCVVPAPRTLTCLFLVSAWERVTGWLKHLLWILDGEF
jgi:hypothetical protein